MAVSPNSGWSGALPTGQRRKTANVRPETRTEQLLIPSWLTTLGTLRIRRKDNEMVVILNVLITVLWVENELFGFSSIEAHQDFPGKHFF
mmetsp:Transcript_74897/g.144930  ORF Transcript_74897/g.144930 Transcript_74897/m.144930 type:complete len:90 (-) Transcript_74897:11-280(-)